MARKSSRDPTGNSIVLLIGALLASFVVAITESLGALFMPGSTAPVLPFVLFILVLLFKPEGLFGARAR